MPKNPKGKKQASEQESSATVVEEQSDVEGPDDSDAPDVELEVVKVQPVPGPARKRIRPSKKEVPAYPFNEEQVKEIAAFVQQHPALYDKTDEKWQNPTYKDGLWKELARTFKDCNYLQVKKLMDKKRTDFGKIEKREKEDKSGSAAGRARTLREQMMFEVWGFLAGHIAHEPTMSSDDFRRKRGDSDSSSQESDLSARSVARRKRQKERREEEVSSPHATKSTQESSAIQQLVQSAELLATRKPPVEGLDADIRSFVEYMYSRLKKVSPVHHGQLFSKIAYMTSLMEEPVMGPTANPRNVLDSVVMATAVVGPSHHWQATTAPTSPPPVAGPSHHWPPPAAPTSAPPVAGPSHHWLPPAAPISAPPPVAGPSHHWSPPAPPTPGSPPVYQQQPHYQKAYQQQPYSHPQFQQQQYQQPQQSEQQQQTQVPTPTMATKPEGHKTKSPRKLNTPKTNEPEGSDEDM